MLECLARLLLCWLTSLPVSLTHNSQSPYSINLFTFFSRRMCTSLIDIDCHSHSYKICTYRKQDCYIYGCSLTGWYLEMLAFCRWENDPCQCLANDKAGTADNQPKLRFHDAAHDLFPENWRGLQHNPFCSHQIPYVTFSCSSNRPAPWVQRQQEQYSLRLLNLLRAWLLSTRCSCVHHIE